MWALGHDCVHFYYSVPLLITQFRDLHVHAEGTCNSSIGWHLYNRKCSAEITPDFIVDYCISSALVFHWKDAWSDSCVTATARIPRSNFICIVLPLLYYRYTLSFLIVVNLLFQVSKLFLEVFECPEIQGVIFLQTVVNFVSIHDLLKYQIHEMSGSFLHWLHPLH